MHAGTQWRGEVRFKRRLQGGRAGAPEACGENAGAGGLRVERDLARGLPAGFGHCCWTTRGPGECEYVGGMIVS